MLSNVATKCDFQKFFCIVCRAGRKRSRADSWPAFLQGTLARQQRVPGHHRHSCRQRALPLRDAPQGAVPKGNPSTRTPRTKPTHIASPPTSSIPFAPPAGVLLAGSSPHVHHKCLHVAFRFPRGPGALVPYRVPRRRDPHSEARRRLSRSHPRARSRPCPCPTLPRLQNPSRESPCNLPVIPSSLLPLPPPSSYSPSSASSATLSPAPAPALAPQDRPISRQHDRRPP